MQKKGHWLFLKNAPLNGKENNFWQLEFTILEIGII